MTGTASLSYDQAAEQVKDMVGRGLPFGDVEHTIDTVHAPPDTKAALWLLAWSLRDRSLERRTHS